MVPRQARRRYLIFVGLGRSLHLPAGGHVKGQLKLLKLKVLTCSCSTYSFYSAYNPKYSLVDQHRLPKSGALDVFYLFFFQFNPI